MHVRDHGGELGVVSLVGPGDTRDSQWGPQSPFPRDWQGPCPEIPTAGEGWQQALMWGAASSSTTCILSLPKKLPQAPLGAPHPSDCAFLSAA